jgi:hypothetical protein
VEEVTIVALILVLWVAAIALFVRRWGKIRMLVPAQPRYVYEEAAVEVEAVDMVKVRLHDRICGMLRLAYYDHAHAHSCGHSAMHDMKHYLFVGLYIENDEGYRNDTGRWHIETYLTYLLQ